MPTLLKELEQDSLWPTAEFRAVVFKAEEEIATMRHRIAVSLFALPDTRMNLT